MPEKQPKIQEITDVFLSSIVEFGNVVLTPLTDLLFNSNDSSLYLYKDGAWRLFPKGNRKTGVFARTVATFLKDNFPQVNITSQRVMEIMDAIERDLPNQHDLADPTPYIAFQDKTLNLKTFKLEVHDRAHHAFHYYDFPFNGIQKETPVFDNFINTTFDDDNKTLGFIYEMIGFYLLPHTIEPAAFYLYGQARTGKSTMLDLIRDIIGHHFTSGFSLQSLTNDPFTVVELAGKLLNIVDEDESQYIQSDKMKALISRSYMEAGRKYEQKFTMKPITKYIFASNAFPKIANFDSGMMRRLYFLKFDNPIPKEDQDKKIGDKLRAEIPGIVYKSLKAGKAFMERNEEFRMPDHLEVTKEEFLEDNKPVFRFLVEACIITPDTDEMHYSLENWTKNITLYLVYRKWCEENGHKSMNSNNFHKELLSYPGVVSRRTSTDRLKNIRLKESKPIETFKQ